MVIHNHTAPFFCMLHKKWAYILKHNSFININLKNNLFSELRIYLKNLKGATVFCELDFINSIGLIGTYWCLWPIFWYCYKLCAGYYAVTSGYKSVYLKYILTGSLVTIHSIKGCTWIKAEFWSFKVSFGHYHNVMMFFGS